MKIDRVVLLGYRGIKQLELTFDSWLNVLIGINGSGKSSILDAIAILLSWVSARAHSHTSSGRQVTEIDINNQLSFCTIEIEVTHEDEKYRWALTRNRKGAKETSKSNLVGASTLAHQLKEQSFANPNMPSLPVLAYYPTNRAVVDIPLRIRTHHTFNILEIYDDSLTSAANFRRFFEWFRESEDYENEMYREDPQFKDSQLQAVRNAIAEFTGFKNIKIRRNPLRMEVVKQETAYDVRQFSDGEKCLFAMIGDLARRLALANPGLSNPLHGKGVVLIDEIDLHLHPKWQRSVIRNLGRVFPHCQFIVSTHSPQAISEVEAENVRCFYEDVEKGIQYCTPKQAKGLTTDSILEELMNAKSRNEEVAKELYNINLLIEEDNLDLAKEKIDTLRINLKGDIPELVEASSYIKMLESEIVAGDEP